MRTKFQAWWQKARKPLIIVVVIAGALALLVVLVLGYWLSWDWTGLSPYTPPSKVSTFQRGKTLWDWMSLLIIPVILALVGFFFTRTERRNEQAIAKQRADAEQNLAIDNQQESALQGYLDRMAALLLEKNLRESQPGDEVRTVARVRTLTMLFQLNTRRINYMMAFLRESRLVTANTKTSIITFSKADLRTADLHEVNFHDIDLSGADLSGADLSSANLYSAHLYSAHLSKAHLSGAHLSEVNLSGAHLNEADLYKVDLYGANLNKANLNKVDLSEANLSEANLSEANLSETNLSETNLSEANLSGADLSGADLSGAFLFRASLSGANLKNAKVTPEQLEKAASLKGATMPDGSPHP